MKKYTSLLLTIAILALFIWYALSHQSLFHSLAAVSVWSLLLIALARLVIIFDNGWFTKWSVEAFVGKMNAYEGWLISVLTAVGNFFGPLVGGLGFRAYYLNKYHKLPLTKFTSTLVGYYLIMYFFNALMAIAGLLFLPRTHQTIYALIFFAAWAVVTVAVTFIRLPDRRRLGFIDRNKAGRLLLKIIYEVEDGWRVILSHRRLLVKMMALASLNLLATLFMSFVEFHALGIKVGLAGLALYTALVEASMFVAVTPDAVGVREVILVLVSATIGITHGQVLQVAVIDRGVQFVVLGLLFMSVRHSKIRTLLTTAKTPSPS